MLMDNCFTIFFVNRYANDIFVMQPIVLLRLNQMNNYDL